MGEGSTILEKDSEHLHKKQKARRQREAELLEPCLWDDIILFDEVYSNYPRIMQSLGDLWRDE